MMVCTYSPSLGEEAETARSLGLAVSQLRSTAAIHQYVATVQATPPHEAVLWLPKTSTSPMQCMWTQPHTYICCTKLCCEDKDGILKIFRKAQRA